MAPAVPVIDLSLPKDDVAKQVYDACSTAGFFYGAAGCLFGSHGGGVPVEWR